jgi:hypothetical protein
LVVVVVSVVLAVRCVSLLFVVPRLVVADVAAFVVLVSLEISGLG